MWNYLIKKSAKNYFWPMNQKLQLMISAKLLKEETEYLD